jgi:hypothetical protein
VKERPIIFSAPMVRAILAGTKTQTRRIVTTREPLGFIGGRGEEADPDKWGWFFDGPDHHGYMVLGRGHNEQFGNGSISIPCPYGEVGDRLWVRETWAGARIGRHASVFYRASCDGDECDFVDPDDGSMRRIKIEKWRPSIFLPHGAHRITLEITEVRVQRLQSIDGDDAAAEGITVTRCGCEVCRMSSAMCPADASEHVMEFARLWDSINGKRAPWESNPGSGR